MLENNTSDLLALARPTSTICQINLSCVAAYISLVWCCSLHQHCLVLLPTSALSCVSAYISIVLCFSLHQHCLVLQPTSTLSCVSAYIELVLFQPTSALSCVAAYITLVLCFSLHQHWSDHGLGSQGHRDTVSDHWSPGRGLYAQEGTATKVPL